VTRGWGLQGSATDQMTSMAHTRLRPWACFCTRSSRMDSTKVMPLPPATSSTPEKDAKMVLPGPPEKKKRVPAIRHIDIH